MQDQNSILPAPKRTPWNKGKLTGAKPPLLARHVWSIRTKLQIEKRTPTWRCSISPSTASYAAGRDTVPDYRAVIEAVTRRDQARFVVDGMTAANDLGLTTAVPARIEVLVDTRLKPIKLGNQEIRFKAAAPSRLYWAGRPAMRVVQALHWMQDMLAEPNERSRVGSLLQRLFANPRHGQAIHDDLRRNLSTLPIWMQEFLRPAVTSAGSPRAANARHAGA